MNWIFKLIYLASLILAMYIGFYFGYYYRIKQTEKEKGLNRKL